MNLQKASRWFVSIVLFAACVVLALLAQAQSGGGGQTPNPTNATPNGISATQGVKPRMPITGGWAGVWRPLNAAP